MPEDLTEVESLLLRDEFDLWRTMPTMDQRHSIAVMHRFKDLRPNASLPEIRSALLHDIGKIQANLGILGRVVATLVDEGVNDSLRITITRKLVVRCCKTSTAISSRFG